jgi:hypothetical protein
MNSHNHTKSFYEDAAIEFVTNNSAPELKTENNEIHFIKIFAAVDHVHQHTNDSAVAYVTKGFDEVVSIITFPLLVRDKGLALIKIHRMWTAIFAHLLVYKYTFIGISSREHCCNIRNADFEYRFSFKSRIDYTCNH